ncbi:MAG TPA: hypothetical protein VNH11_24070 [Pirellulales bacterium]|nr:hypothetical protein [Pirellulales bacterium]
MLVEQAIFTSADTGRRDGYQLVATSPGVDEADLRALASRGPSHDSLWETGDDAMSVNCYALPSGCYCVSKTTPAGQEHSGRRGPRVYTQCLVVGRELLADFANNALALLNAAFAQGHLRVLEEISGDLDPFKLCGRAAAVDEALLGNLLSDPGVLWLQAVVEAALTSPRVALLAPNHGPRLLAGLMNCLPVECRLEFSFSTGLKYSPRRPLRIVCLGGHLAEQRRLARRYELTMVEVFGRPPREFTATAGWGGFVASAIAAGKTAFLAEQLSASRPGLTLADLEPLGNQLLEWMAEGPRGPSTNMCGRKPRGELPAAPAEALLAAATGDAPAEARRADAAHLRGNRPSDVPAPPVRSDWADDPAQVVGGQCPAAIEKLELLDDTVFEAIAGRPGALDELRRLWPEVQAQVGPDLVEESREQYLRHALRVWQDCVAGDQIHNPALALATMDVMCLLFGDS